MYADYRFREDSIYWFGTFGLTVVPGFQSVKHQASILGNLRFSALPVIPNFGIGYGMHRDNGFALKIQGLVLGLAVLCD